MIVIPMAGQSRRFSERGYTTPKFMLPLWNGTVFGHAVNSFNAYFETEKFLFILGPCGDSKENISDFVKQEASRLGIRKYQIAELESKTRGQAETVYLGLKLANMSQGSITIFNIDTFRPEFRYPDWLGEVNGYLETFTGEGKNWSTVKYDSQGFVSETAEKKMLSEQCCTGLYHWANVDDFEAAFKAYLEIPSSQWVNGELYVAPLYNHLISSKSKVRYQNIKSEEVYFCGIPDEYETLIQKAPKP